MPKTDNGGASSWRTADNKYREQERKRRKANALRRREVEAAAQLGVTVEQLRKENPS